MCAFKDTCPTAIPHIFWSIGLHWIHPSDGTCIDFYLDYFLPQPSSADLAEGLRRGAWFSVLTKRS